METWSTRGHHPSGNWRHSDNSWGTVIWKLQKSLYLLRSAPRCWQDHLGDILRKCGFVSNMLDTCLWTHPTKLVSLVFHVDDLLLARTRQIVTEIHSELRRDLELNSSEVTTKPTLPGTNPGKNKGRSTTLESMLGTCKTWWRSSTCPRSRAHLR